MTSRRNWSAFVILSALIFYGGIVGITGLLGVKSEAMAESDRPRDSVSIGGTKLGISTNSTTTSKNTILVKDNRDQQYLALSAPTPLTSPAHVIKLPAANSSISTHSSITIPDSSTFPSTPTATIQFTSIGSFASEQTTSPTIIASIAQAWDADVAIQYSVTDGTAVGGKDFILPIGKVVIPAGQTSALVPLSIIDDAVYEQNETIVITLSNPSSNAVLGSRSSFVQTILDNDALPGSELTIIGGSSGGGGGGGASFYSASPPTSSASSVLQEAGSLQQSEVADASTTANTDTSVINNDIVSPSTTISTSASQSADSTVLTPTITPRTDEQNEISANTSVQINETLEALVTESIAVTSSSTDTDSGGVSTANQATSSSNVTPEDTTDSTSTDAIVATTPNADSTTAAASAESAASAEMVESDTQALVEGAATTLVPVIDSIPTVDAITIDVVSSAVASLVVAIVDPITNVVTNSAVSGSSSIVISESQAVPAEVAVGTSTTDTAIVQLSDPNTQSQAADTAATSVVVVPDVSDETVEAEIEPVIATISDSVADAVAIVLSLPAIIETDISADSTNNGVILPWNPDSTQEQQPEPISNTIVCDANATRSGSVCTCNDGYIGDGLSCKAKGDHRLRFFLHPDVVGELSIDELKRRLVFYAEDINKIFAKQTIRRFNFDPEKDITITETKPHTDSASYLPDIDYEMWVHAIPDDLPGYSTSRGSVLLDESGAGGAIVKWNIVYDRSVLLSGSNELEQYWGQIKTTIHEFEHVFGAGGGEYYYTSFVSDTTGVDPIINIQQKIDNPFWGKRTDYFSDPLLNNIWNLDLVGNPTSYEDLIKTTRFADVSVAIINKFFRSGGQTWWIDTVPDLDKTKIQIIDKENSRPVQGAKITIFNVDQYNTKNLTIASGSTDSDGRFSFSWACPSNFGLLPFPQVSILANSCHLKLIKVQADGYQSQTEWVSSYDAQKVKLVDGKDEMVITVAMPQQDCGANATRVNASVGPACACNDGYIGDGSSCTVNGEHRLRFFLHPDLVAGLSDEELKRRLVMYAEDINTIFAKQTIRRFNFDPENDITITNTKPQTDFTSYLPLSGYEVWIHAVLTNKPGYGTYGGYSGFDSSGAGVAAGLKWDAVHDRSGLSPNSNELMQYWRQIDHIVHELEHVFGAGSSEYYNLATVRDKSGIEPIVDIVKNASNPFWGKRTDYFSDPLLNNIWNLDIVGRPASYEDLMDIVQFAEVTAAILNSPARMGSISLGLKNIPDLSRVKVHVVDKEFGRPLASTQISVVRGCAYCTELQTVVVASGTTDADGDFYFPWSCGTEEKDRFPNSTPFGNFCHLQLIKARAEGYESQAEWISLFDAQEVKMVEGKDEMAITVGMPQLPCDANATRVDASASPECTCNDGYTGDGFFCKVDGEHRLRFFLHPDLVADLTTDELKRRLVFYAEDINTIFAKQTIRRFTFDPEKDITITETEPQTNHGTYPLPLSGYEMWVHADFADPPEYRGYSLIDASGAGGAAGLTWNMVYDRSSLTDSSPELQEYWRQIGTIVHEFAHTFGAGIGEYYWMSNVRDTTGIEPIVNIRKEFKNSFFGEHTDYFADPLLNSNIFGFALVGSPTSYEDIMDTIQFARVSVAVINSPFRLGGTSALWWKDTVPDLRKVRVHVVNENGMPITNVVTIQVFNVASNTHMAEAIALGGAGVNGDIYFPWDCGKYAGQRLSEILASSAPQYTPFSNICQLKLIKVSAGGYKPQTVWASIYDAQEAKLVDGKNEFVIEVRMKKK